MGKISKKIFLSIWIILFVVRCSPPPTSIININVTPTKELQKSIEINKSELIEQPAYLLNPNELIGIGDSFKLVKNKNNNHDVLELANKIYQGYLFSNYLFKDNPKYLIDNINWDIQYSTSPSTYNLGLQTLDMVGILSYAYLETQDGKYLKRAHLILESWIDYLESSPSNKYVWYDHSVSSRILNIIYFLSINNVDFNTKNYFSEVDEKKLIEVLKLHAEYLMNPSNYAFNNNHGIMADRALIVLAVFLPNEYQSQKWMETGIKRLEDQYYSLFKPDGSYTENSPGYAQGALYWFIEIQEFLTRYGYKLNIYKLDNNLENSHQFLLDTTMPNEHFPMFGDTLDAEVNYNYFNNSLKLPHEFNVYNDGGYAFINNFEKKIWLGFKAGYVGGTAHKHEDELSFVLFAKETNIFIDPGMYNYETSNLYRQYFISANAHNTIIVDGKSFSTSLINDQRSGIISWEENENYYRVTAFSDLYSGTSIIRSVFFTKSGIILIFDDIQSLESHTYSQLFHLDEEILPIQQGENHLKLIWDDGEKEVGLFQMTNNPELLIHNGNENIPGYGLISRDINQLIESRTLEFQLQGTQAKFITMIDLGNSVSSYDIKNEEDKLQIEIFDHSHQLIAKFPLKTKLTQPNSFQEYSAKVRLGDVPVKIIKQQINKNSLVYSLVLDETIKDDYLYTWYLHKNGVVIEKYNWSYDNSLEILDLEPGIYEVQAYLRNIKKEIRSTGIIDKLYISEK